VFEVEGQSLGSEVTDLPNADPGIQPTAMSSLLDVNTSDIKKIICCQSRTKRRDVEI
jgi:hypothetical protein